CLWPTVDTPAAIPPCRGPAARRSLQLAAVRPARHQHTDGHGDHEYHQQNQRNQPLSSQEPLAPSLKHCGATGILVEMADHPTIAAATPVRICAIASEVAPLAKTGGLADVAAALTKY